MALREINLIPDEMLTRRRMKRHLSFWAACLLVPLLLITGFRLFGRLEAKAESAPVADLRDLQKNRNAAQEKILAMQKELETLKAEQASLCPLLKNATHSNVLLKLTDLMNGQTWLTQMSIRNDRGSGGSAQVLLDGFSFQNDDLGDFMDHLAGDPFFESVQLQYAKEAAGPGSADSGDRQDSMIQFQISCVVTRGTVQ
ncbi:MAG: PilN domain-containing protein [Pseudomonadota bacterium]